VNNSYVYVGIGIAIVIVGTLLIFQFESKNPIDTYTTNSDISSMGTDRLSSTNGTKIISDPVSCHIQKKVLDAIGHLYKTPQVLPTGYSLQDGLLTDNNTSARLLYAKGPLCGLPDPAIVNGAIRFYADKLSNAKIPLEQKYFERRKSEIQNEHIPVWSFFEINGNPAIGWDGGKMKGTVMTATNNGTIIESLPISYQSEIDILDSVDKVLYTIDGFHSLDELKSMARSMG
jgi:hypothetical protein